MWSRFEEEFLELWSNEELHKGQAYLRGMYPDADGLEKARQGYMGRLWQVIAVFQNKIASGLRNLPMPIWPAWAGKSCRLRCFLSRRSLKVLSRATGIQQLVQGYLHSHAHTTDARF